MSDRLGTLLREQVTAMSAHALMPPAHAVAVAGRRRRRVHAAVPAVLVAVLAVVVVPAALEAPDRVAQPAGPRPTAAAPDEQRLRSAFATLPAAARIARVVAVQPSSLAAGEFGDVAREQSAGVTGETADRTMSVTWVVLDPALGPDEGDRRARTALGSSGAEALTRVATGAAQGAVRSVVYRTGGGSFVTISAWSEDGGFVALTYGRGATTSDSGLADLEGRARSLLTAP